MNAIDTNLWIYLHDQRDPRKQQIATNLVSTLPGIVLPWQVGCEFIAAARKLQPFGFDQHLAWTALRKMQDMSERILLPHPADWESTQQLCDHHSISFWDGLILATCLRHGVDAIYSEDLPGIAGLGAMKIINPMA